MAFTFFFRDLHVLDLVVRHTAPMLMGRSFARVWDAGSAMGPEPYSLTILLAEQLGPFAFKNLRVHATDLDDCGTFGPIIMQGVYPDAELERIPPEYRTKYFQPADAPGFSRVIESVRARMHFQQHDLLSLRAVGEGFSLVMCKNVLLHFSAAQRIEVIRMFHSALAPDGLLAMEQTQKLPDELAPLFARVVDDAQLYRKLEVQ